MDKNIDKLKQEFNNNPNVIYVIEQIDKEIEGLRDSILNRDLSIKRMENKIYLLIKLIQELN